MFETWREEGVLAFRQPGTRWLSTGWRGGQTTADAAYSVTVGTDWHPEAIEPDVRRRLRAAGVDWDDEPVLITGVDAENARGARCGPVEAYATVGLANPAALPMDPGGGRLPNGEWVAGTVNLVVGTTRDLGDGALANLIAVAAEAKTATLLHAVGFPGTTSDAVVVASDPAGDPGEFSGSATEVGAAARACVRESILGAYRARYDDEEPPETVEDAEHGVVTDVRATTLDPT